MKRKSRRTSKYLLLALILIAVFVLPGCRTRLTNNSEVSNVQYDEDGYMSDMYQMRRDELGLTTAERPILPDLGSGQSDENDDFSEGEEINYNPEDYQEDFTEPQTNTNTNTNTTNNNRGTHRRPNNNSSIDNSSGTTSRSNRVKVTFDANDGTITVDDREEKTYTIMIRRGNQIGELPTAKKGNVTTNKWSISKTGGSNVKSSDTVNEDTYLYADWSSGEEQSEEEKYEVTIKYNNGASDKKAYVKKGENFSLPDPGNNSGKPFTGWKVEGESKLYKIGESVPIKTDTTIEAQWGKKKYYKVTLIGDGDDKKVVEVEEGTEYQLPPIPPQVGYTSTWNTAKDGNGTNYKPGEKVKAEIKLYVYREIKKPEEYWNDVFNEAKKNKESVNCYIVGSEKEKKLITGCVAESVDKDDSPKYVFFFVESFDDAITEEIPSGATAYLVGKQANSSENELLNKIIIMNIIHPGSIEGEETAKEELSGSVLVEPL